MVEADEEGHLEHPVHEGGVHHVVVGQRGGAAQPRHVAAAAVVAHHGARRTSEGEAAPEGVQNLNLNVLVTNNNGEKVSSEQLFITNKHIRESQRARDNTSHQAICWRFY